jgi:hypothetical protein
MSEVTENTVNAFVAEFLRSRGLQVSTEYSGRSSLGRNQPDFYLRNSGIVFGEGEWESSFMKGLKQATDFTNLPGATGAFVISYPDKMREVLRRRLTATTTPDALLKGFRFRGLLILKGRRAELFHGSAEEAAQWLQDGLLHRQRPENAGAFVALMRDIVESLSGYLPTSGDYPTFFEHIIATMPKDAGELDTARRAAAYLLLNQVVFYRILSKHKYDELDPALLETPGDLQRRFFNRVLEDDYAAIFASEVAPLFPDRSLPFIKDMISTVNAVQPESFTRDLLGSVFHELIPDTVRKSVAAFYTNPEAARLLAKLTIDEPAATVADFSCGSGTLLMAAYDRKAELTEGGLTQDAHQRFLEEEITGCDIMPFAAHLAVVQLALRQPDFLTDKVRIAVQDSTTLRPGMTISPLQSSMPQGQTRLQMFAEETLERSKVRRGAISGQGRGHSFTLEKLDATLMNPPFTRKQLIGKDYRVLLTSRFKEYSDFESREQSLFGYFVFLADRFLKSGGRMGFVLPTTAIRQGSSEGMRRLIRDRYDLEYLVSSGHEMAFSEDANFSEVLLVARKRKPGAKPRDSFVAATVLAKPTLENMSVLVSTLADAQSSLPDAGAAAKGVVTGRLLQYRVAKTAELESPDWVPLIPGEDPIAVSLPAAPAFVPLSSLVGEDGVIQGIRFEGSSDTVNVKNTIVSRRRDVGSRLNWVITSEASDSIHAQSQTTGAEVDIPLEAIQPAMRTPAGQRTMLISPVPDYAVNARFSHDAPFWDDPAPDQIVSRRRAHLRSREGRVLLAGRNHVNVLSEGTYHLAFTAGGLIVPTWSFWSLRPHDQETADSLCLWLNSTFAFTHLFDRRIIGTGVYIGWLKSDLLGLPVPDFGRLTTAQRAELRALFTRLAGAVWEPLYPQYKQMSAKRVDLDTSLARVLQLDGWQSREKLEPVYAAVVQKLETLRDVGRG